MRGKNEYFYSANPASAKRYSVKKKSKSELKGLETLIPHVIEDVQSTWDRAYFFMLVRSVYPAKSELFWNPWCFFLQNTTDTGKYPRYKKRPKCCRFMFCDPEPGTWII